MEHESTVTVTQFLTVIIPLFSGVLITAYIIFDKINAIRTNVKSIQEQQTHVSNNVRDAKIDIGELQGELKILLEKRNQDLLDFTHVLGKINVTLGRFEVTLKIMEEGFREMKDVFKDKK